MNSPKKTFNIRLAGIGILSAIALILTSCQHCEAPIQDSNTVKISNEDRVASARARHGDYYANRLAIFLEDTPKQMPGGVVFLGDSITERFPLEVAFPGKHVINRGIGGDNVEGVIDRLDVSVKDLYPSKVYVMIGINNLWGEGSMEVLKESYKRLFAGLKQAAPNTKIYFLSILPVAGRMPQVNERVLKVNAILKQMCKDERIPFIDLYPLMDNGNHEIWPEYAIDGVHLTTEGYQTWLEAILTPQEYLEAVISLDSLKEDIHRPSYPLTRIDPPRDGAYPGSRGPDEMILYTPAYGHTSTGTNEWGKEVIIRNGMVEKPAPGGNTTIPADGAIISGHGKAAAWIGFNLKIGTRIKIEGKEVKLIPTPESEIPLYQRLNLLRKRIIDQAVKSKDNYPRALRRCRSLLAQVAEIHRDPSLLTKEKLDKISAAVTALQ